eukprot:TRINITY_DN41797_c0_g1_i1.p1 TRINITY_DN41797_c0_g1~~TRINITY_DN41797_c0_g1_i1.p1  ORF type:complete len:192 (-),score=40.72 TRINITY_DN41797_c0_g1_i1:83-658(-)
MVQRPAHEFSEAEEETVCDFTGEVIRDGLVWDCNQHQAIHPFGFVVQSSATAEYVSFQNMATIFDRLTALVSAAHEQQAEQHWLDQCAKCASILLPHTRVCTKIIDTHFKELVPQLKEQIQDHFPTANPEDLARHLSPTIDGLNERLSWCASVESYASDDQPPEPLDCIGAVCFGESPKHPALSCQGTCLF